MFLADIIIIKWRIYVNVMIKGEKKFIACSRVFFCELLCVNSPSECFSSSVDLEKKWSFELAADAIKEIGTNWEWIKIIVTKWTIFYFTKKLISFFIILWFQRIFSNSQQFAVFQIEFCDIRPNKIDCLNEIINKSQLC